MDIRISQVYAPALVVLLFIVTSPIRASQASQGEGAAARTAFDGPAELPRVFIRSALADTPAPGHVRLVKGSDSLQEALDGAKFGDTLKLQATATFTGVFRLPEKPCDDGHWIILRTSAPDDSLPAANTRITPCYAGVASLPNRPDFRCVAARNVMARIEFDGKGGSGPLFFSPGANHYRLIGLEITRGNPGAKVQNLVSPADKGTADHIIFDRVWLHGTAQDETTRGIHLSGTTYIAVIDSFFTDFHCIAMTGACTDAEAISGGGGSNPSGPYKIINNFLEASGENLLFGGSGATQTPADIEIRRNYLFKPIVWKPNQPGFVGAVDGHPFIVKNHFELKNAQRVLFEGNTLENSWGGFTQTGFSILLTPKNQSPNVCPLCRVTDVTIRFNKISHVASALQIANVLSDTGGMSTAGERYSIHDLLVDDIDGETYKGFGAFALILSVDPPLKDVKIDHVTAFPPRVLFSIINNVERAKISNVTITNNLFTASARQIGSAGGGPKNCAFHPEAQGPAGVLKSCFANATFTHNLIVGGDGGWPPGNIVVRNAGAVGIRDFHDGRGGDYRLCKGKDDSPSCKAASPYLHSGTNGRELGADIEAIERVTAGSQ